MNGSPRRIIMWALVIVAVVGVMIAATASPPSPRVRPTPTIHGWTDASDAVTPRSSRGTVVRVAAWDRDRQRYAAVARQIEQELGDIAIVLVSLDDLVVNAPAEPTPEAWRPAAAAVTSSADVIPSFPWIANAGAAGMAANLRSAVAALPPDVVRDFAPGALPDAPSDEPLWVIPGGIRPTFMRVALTDALPGAPGDVTWTDVVSAVQRVRSGPNPPIGILDATGGASVMSGALLAMGVDLRRVAPHDVRLSDPTMRTALERVCRWIEDGTVAIGLDQDAVALARPESAATWASLPAADSADAQWIVWPQPETAPLQTSIAGWSISAAAGDRSAAWRVVVALTAYADQALPPDMLPARQSALARSLAGRRMPEGARAAIASAWRRDHRIVDPAITGALSDAVDRACIQRRPIAAALEEAQRTLTALLARPIVSAPVAPPTPAPPTPAPDVRAGVIRLGVHDRSVLHIAQAAVAPQGWVVQAAPLPASGNVTREASANDCVILDAPLDEALAALMRAAGGAAPTAPPAVQAMVQRADGALIGVPWRASAAVLAYRPSLFRAAGVAEPTDQWTWDDVDAAAAILTRATPQGVRQYGYAPHGSMLADLVWRLESRNAALMTLADGRPRMRMSDPRVIDEVERYLRLVQPLRDAGARFADDDGRWAQSMRDLIAEGRVAMWLSFADAIPDDPDVRAVAWPRDAALPPSVVRVSALFILDGSPHADQCAAIARALMRNPPLLPGMIAIDAQASEDDPQRAVRRSLDRRVDRSAADVTPPMVLRWAAHALDAVRDRASLERQLAWLERRAYEYRLCMEALDHEDAERICAEAVRPDAPPPTMVGDPPTGD